MHVCHLIHSFGAGGAEQVLVELGKVAARSGVRMSVIVLVRGDDAANTRELRALGLEVRTLGLRSRWDPRAFGRATRAVRALRPDLVHTHLKHADLVGAVVSRRLGLPMVSTLHLIEDEVSRAGAAKRWLAEQARHRTAARTIAVSRAQRRWYLDTFGGDPTSVVTVYNGVLPGAPLTEEQREEVRSSFGVHGDVVLAASVALMRPGKGHEDLLAAVSRLPDGIGLVVLLVGDGPERARLEFVARTDPALSRRVRFTGYRDDVPRLLQAVDLVVHPAHADALPTALLHALAAGVPILATDVGGVAEIVDGGSGVLVPPRDPERLAAELLALCRDPDRRRAMGECARSRFDELFHADAWSVGLGAVYADALDASRRRARSSAP